MWKVAMYGLWFWAALSVAASPCSAKRGVEFSDVRGGSGYFLFGHYGRSGFSAYLHAKSLRFPDAEFQGFFELDGVMYQHVFVPREKYLPPLELDDRDELQHHYEWELAHLRDTAKREAELKLGKQTNYGAVEPEARSGEPRTFWIWDAEIADAKQIWVTTRVPDGIVAITALGYTRAQEPQVRAVVDNYMYRFELCKEVPAILAPQ
ncbi:MAG: hypothetical protein MUE46_19510 [Xanthomonadales bacterium]|jgi:hypothetical protein|nr:hypothetical protein [Xanthomonadales bacterium]